MEIEGDVVAVVRTGEAVAVVSWADVCGVT